MTANLHLSRFERDLGMAGRATGTIPQYVSSLRRFLEFLEGEPEMAEQEEIRLWVELLQRQSIGPERLRCHYSALKFFYGKTLGQPEKVAFISMPGRRAPLPTVLGLDEVRRLLDGFTTATYRAFAFLLLATGMRINEACMLDVADIDSAQMVIRVRHGKGDWERIVPLSVQLRDVLRSYYKLHRHRKPDGPQLFTNRHGGRICSPTATRALLSASAMAGLCKVVKPHTLRHTLATRLLEMGVDLRTIQVLLGHRSINSTTIYTRVAPGQIASLPNPFAGIEV
jgi:site-specific recombinase XerD